MAGVQDYNLSNVLMGIKPEKTRMTAKQWDVKADGSVLISQGGIMYLSHCKILDSEFIGRISQPSHVENSWWLVITPTYIASPISSEARELPNGRLNRVHECSPSAPRQTLTQSVDLDLNHHLCLSLKFTVVSCHVHSQIWQVLERGRLVMIVVNCWIYQSFSNKPFNRSTVNKQHQTKNKKLISLCLWYVHSKETDKRWKSAINCKRALLDLLLGEANHRFNNFSSLHTHFNFPGHHHTTALRIQTT